jgi:hypothetical protein
MSNPRVLIRGLWFIGLNGSGYSHLRIPRVQTLAFISWFPVRGGAETRGLRRSRLALVRLAWPGSQRGG